MWGDAMKKETKKLRESYQRSKQALDSLIKKSQQETNAYLQQLKDMAVAEHSRREKILQDHVDIFLELVNEHISEGCSDEKHVNEECMRCCLLELKRNGYWMPENKSVELSLVTLEYGV